MFTEEFVLKNSKVKLISDSADGIKVARKDIFCRRKDIEKYIALHPEFLSSLEPLGIDEKAPKIVREMASAASLAAVGPMAAVAGAIAESACRAMQKAGADTALVENGGDCFAITNRPCSVGIFTGENRLKDKLAFGLEKGREIAFCSSSSLLGHSLSFGKCDLATVFAKKGAVADAFATALANRVEKEEDIDNALHWLQKEKAVEGALVIKSGRIGLVGQIPRLLRSRDKMLEAKITSF